VAVAWRYVPPKLDAVPVIHAAGEAGVQAAADVLLEASQRLVPVDTGALRDSGQVTQEGLEAAVSYGREDGAGRDGQDTAAYAAVQHERLDYAHPNGQAKYLEQPMSSEREAIVGALAEELRKALAL
jgi:hypothetical protein